MALNGTLTFVGFGFGAIQSGLFLYEAYQSGNFKRLVVAEVLPEVVDEIRAADGYFTINIAQPDHIDNIKVGPIEIYNPTVPEDRQKLVEAIAEAQEIATAIPSVNYYASDKDSSLHRVLADGLIQKVTSSDQRAVIYTAENNNHAAEILKEHVMSIIPTDAKSAVEKQVRFLETVIGKMSGVISDTNEILGQKLANVTPDSPRLFLVEAFNRILISRIDFDQPFQRGIEVLVEKADHLRFEEAKLYGHNATHALAAYLAHLKGLEYISDVRDVPGMMDFLRSAFLEESGAALIRKYDGSDPLFTEAGYQEYVDDLLVRMTNPYLRDAVARVGRDPARKLGWDDRLVGTMRLALSQGIQPKKYAMGAAAALVALHDSDALESDQSVAEMVDSLWKAANPNPSEREKIIQLIEQGRIDLKDWLD